MANKKVTLREHFEIGPDCMTLGESIAAERAMIKLSASEVVMKHGHQRLTLEERDALFKKFPVLMEFARVAGV